MAGVFKLIGLRIWGPGVANNKNQKTKIYFSKLFTSPVTKFKTSSFYKSKGLSQETPILLLKVLLDINFKRIRQYLHPRRGYVYRSRVRQLHMGVIKFQNIFTIAENVNWIRPKTAWIVINSLKYTADTSYYKHWTPHGCKMPAGHARRHVGFSHVEKPAGWCHVFSTKISFGNSKNISQLS